MGQSVVALMYGVKASSLSKHRNDDGEFPWESLPWDDQPRDAYEGDAVGFSVAVSGGGDPDEGDLGEPCSLLEIGKTHAKRISAAKKKWQSFAKWCAKENIALPEPALLLTRDERA